MLQGTVKQPDSADRIQPSVNCLELMSSFLSQARPFKPAESVYWTASGAVHLMGCCMACLLGPTGRCADLRECCVSPQQTGILHNKWKIELLAAPEHHVELVLQTLLTLTLTASLQTTVAHMMHTGLTSRWRSPAGQLHPMIQGKGLPNLVSTFSHACGFIGLPLALMRTWALQLRAEVWVS